MDLSESGLSHPRGSRLSHGYQTRKSDRLLDEQSHRSFEYCHAGCKRRESQSRAPGVHGSQTTSLHRCIRRSSRTRGHPHRPVDRFPIASLARRSHTSCSCSVPPLPLHRSLESARPAWGSPGSRYCRSRLSGPRNTAGCRRCTRMSVFSCSSPGRCCRRRLRRRLCRCPRSSGRCQRERSLRTAHTHPRRFRGMSPRC